MGVWSWGGKSKEMGDLGPCQEERTGLDLAAGQGQTPVTWPQLLCSAALPSCSAWQMSALGQVTPLKCTDVGSGFIFPPSHFDFSAAPHALTMSTGRVRGCSPHPGFGGTLTQQELGVSTQDPLRSQEQPCCGPSFSPAGLFCRRRAQPDINSPLLNTGQFFSDSGRRLAFLAGSLLSPFKMLLSRLLLNLV